MLDQALAVARWAPVFPCDDLKRPLVAGGFKAASKDVKQIAVWWKQWPDALIGVPTGEASGFFVIDLDGVAHGGPDGLVAWDKLTANHPSPATRTHETPNGGVHLLYRYDPQRPVTNRRGALPEGVDVRGDGGYVIWPPSRLPDGRSWRVPENCETEEIASAPRWLYELLAEKPATASGSRPASAYGEAALNGEIAKAAGARRGQRNEALNKAAFSLGQLAGGGALSSSDVEDRLYGAAQASGLVADDGERAVRATIASGLEAGVRQLRDIPAGRRRYRPGRPRQGPDEARLEPPQAEQAQERIPPRIIRPTLFFGREPPRRRWIVPDWIPYGAVTGLYGRDGLGKSLIAQQLQTGTALGASWLGVPVDPIVSLGVYCEDDEDELGRRQQPINAEYGCALDGRLDAVHWMSRLGEDNILMTFTSKGVGELTDFHGEVVAAALDVKAKLVIIDAATDAFGGSDENNRGQARQFVQIALYQIARKIRGAVLCNAHPSRAGVLSGSGESGSTGWSAAFRSRLYFYEPEPEANEPRDYDARVLERMKANYAAPGARLTVRYHKGVFVPDRANTPGMTAAGVVAAKPVFLNLLRELAEQKRPVSSSGHARNYAPREFEKLPGAQRLNFQKRDFERAMNELFREKTIVNVPYGRKGDERTKIVLFEQNGRDRSAAALS